MTEDEFTRRLPPITDNPLPLTPPFEFNGLSARIFPLRANLDALQRLCNGFLNFVPPEVGRFRAVVPYVYLSILDYGEIAELLTNLGWFAQVEVFFAVPVEWYKVVDGKWVFHDWAVITPFIYVDDDLSVPLGRTVYGFPKTMARAVPVLGHWMRNPVASVTLARMNTAVFPELYTGKRLQSRTFLEIERDAPMSNLRVPGDASSPMAPWTIASSAAEAFAGFGRDALWLSQAMRISPVNPADSSGFAAEMMERMIPAMAPGGQGLVLNSLNLKQFRRSDSPQHIGYQALTNGRMQMTAFNAGGLLGEERVFLGDLSGGHLVKLHEYSSLPIARTLGLEVHHRWRGQDVEVVSLKPVLPFWMNVNVTYQQGSNVAWRSHDGRWRYGNGALVRALEGPGPKEAPLYNTTVGTAVDAVAGPFRFTDNTVRVLPLLAHRRRLQDFIDTTINSALDAPAYLEGSTINERVRLSLWTRPEQGPDGQRDTGADYAYVYLTASSFGGVTSKTNNVGDWAEYELSFLIPVKWERLEGDEWTLQGVGVVPAYTFVDDTTAAVARAEVVGIPTSTATFIRPESSWMSDANSRDVADQTLLRVGAEVIPALGVGQQASIQPIIEISVRSQGPRATELPSADLAAQWAQILRDELGSKNRAKAQHAASAKIARALAINLLGNRTPFSLYTLKQFRDVSDPGKACFQSLVRVERLLAEDVDVREFEQTIEVELHDFPTLAIVESLGLVANTIGREGAGIMYRTQAIRPFCVRATVDEPLGKRMVSRAGTIDWDLGEEAFQGMLRGDDDTDPVSVDGRAEQLQDFGNPAQIGAIARAALERLRREGPRGAGDGPISREAARLAVSQIDPQMVIESILSREWAHGGRNSRWAVGRREVLRAAGEVHQGVSAASSVALEAASFAAALAAIVDRPGGPMVRGVVDQMIAQMKVFSAALLKVETSLSVVMAWYISRSYGELVGQQFALTAPDPASLATALRELEEQLRNFPTTVVGEPSPHNNIAIDAAAAFFRLRELVNGPLVPVRLVMETEVAAAEQIETLWPYVEFLREAAALARACAGVQRDALVNKIAKAYQKPDFCIRRDAVGPDCNRLLPLALSWDEEWYAGLDAGEVTTALWTPGAPAEKAPQ